MDFYVEGLYCGLRTGDARSSHLRMYGRAAPKVLERATLP